MSLAVAQSVNKFAKAATDKNSRQAIIEAVGDLDGIKVMQNMVLVATYIRPEKTRGGLLLPESAIEEDIWQGKVGLVLKLGPVAFESDNSDFDRFAGISPKLHDWCVYRVGDAWDITLRGVHCRLVADHNVRLVIDDPEEIF